MGVAFPNLKTANASTTKKPRILTHETKILKSESVQRLDAEP
jgi:hypothetical protein